MAGQYGDRWRVDRTLSQGGQGQVFLVRDLKGEFAGPCVLKRLLNTERIGRLKREILVATELDHPGIVRRLDHDLDGPRPYLVLEYCEGGTLSELPFPGNDPLPELRLFHKILQAMEHAHGRGVVHRDLKPDNIFLRADRRTPVVGDFGLCFFDLDDGTRLTRTDEAVGSRLYMAPELADGGAGFVSSSVDVYALGKILYWLFRRRVFDREKHRLAGWTLAGPTTDLPEYRIPERELIMTLLDRSIAEDPDRRFSDAKQFRAQVERLIWRIERHAQPVSLDVEQICNFCGLGSYQPFSDAEEPGRADIERFGLRHRDDARFLVLWCNHCGHTQLFRRDILRRDPWS